METVLIYGTFSSAKELEQISSMLENDNRKIIIANNTNSKYKIHYSDFKEKFDLIINFENLNDLNVFEKMDIKIISLNELLYESYDFKISVIIPVYNTQEYIHESLNSIINQSMELKDIQIIIVNDGSTDDSDFILSKFQKLYPDNIKYISKENEGVSIARNTGLKYAKGKYINFIDSDDKWGLTTLKNVYHFFEENPTIDVISTRLRFFDGMVGEHPLNFKYENKENKIVDLNIDYDHIQMNVSSAFFRASALKGLTFDTTLKYGEDAKFVFNVLRRTFRIGLMSYTQGCYWYRKRKDESSAIDTALKRQNYYSHTLDKFHNYLANEYKRNHLPKYVQMMILYDLQYRLKYQNTTLSTLNNTQIEAYTQRIINLLKVIDDEVINNPNLKQINAVYRVAILAVKYEGYNFNISKEDGVYKIFSNNIFIKNITDMYLKTEYIYEKNTVLKCGFSLPNINMNIDVTPVLVINKKEIIHPDNDTIITEQTFLNRNISFNKFYRFDIHLHDSIKTIEVKYLINNQTLEDIKQVSKTQHTNFSNTKIPFRQYKNRTLKLINNNKIINSKKHRIPVIKNILGLLKKHNTRKSGIYKLIGIINKKINNKKIWLFIDRLDKAGDNAEALFDYVYNNKKDVTPFFLINASSQDYIKLQKKYGPNVVGFNSKKHHLLMFKAEKVFSSHSEAYLNNPFGTINGKFIRELLDFEFIFLQHGILQNDLSNLLHKRNKPMDYFITSAKKEKEEVIQKYGFSENEVLLSGLSRFDLLKNNKKKKEKNITIMPTWRPHLLGASDNEFLNSLFFKSLIEFLSNFEIQKIAKKNNVQLNLCLHPRMQARFSKFFDTLANIEVIDHVDYKKVISDTDILITDVSSIAFDVAYLKKPILYYHFDINEIYSYSAYEPGYFNYLENGFGPVVNDSQALVSELMKIKKNNYKMSKFYLRRVESFFEFGDGFNRQRTIDLIS
ncbi:CDP-glycerol glycerophosphotransferase family protein [Mammaliicoccus sciuri]|uniref:bifunctional glycosyltransferase/CDP-glycerol:glycerophosphate glycerophosphotransferase n=1 Tax=Mammaliicoccus sciuri TaxID=1296 RepID=UPI003364DF4A